MDAPASARVGGLYDPGVTFRLGLLKLNEMSMELIILIG